MDCVINNHPEFSKTSLGQANLNQVYEESIRVSISNSLMDLEYRHTFTVEGDLPPGMSYETSGREITFTGTPTELGDFPFTLSVLSSSRSLGPNEDPNNLPERLCSDTESQSLTLSVIQGF